MKIRIDTHTHTLAVDHAFSTLSENIAAAREKGLAAIAMTEHSPSMPGAPSWLHFASIGIIPAEIDGVKIIRGIEVNIMDYDGKLDFPDKYLKKLEWVIASMHTTNIAPSTPENHTKAWLSIAKNPLVDVIGHCGDPRYAFDYERVIKAFKDGDKIVEINAHSFNARPGSYENCAEIAKLCAKYRVPVVASSDAHHANMVGKTVRAEELLEEVGFPEELVLNADEERFFAEISERNRRKAMKSGD